MGSTLYLDSRHHLWCFFRALESHSVTCAHGARIFCRTDLEVHPTWLRPQAALGLFARERPLLQDRLRVPRVVAAHVARVLLQDPLADPFVVAEAVEDAGEG